MFNDFWAASRFSPLHQRRLGERLRDFRPQPPLIDPLELPTAPQPLPKPTDRLQKLFQARKSTREFTDKPLTDRQLGAVLGALGDNSVPSAGGLNPLHCYAFHHNRAVRYDIRRHALQDIGEAPGNLAEILGTPEVPPLAIVLVLKDNEAFDKYGERAGRFGLIEAGAAAQSICLRLAEQKLGGCLLGGVADNEMLHALGLPRELRVATAIACGHIRGT
ncbi:nitroreductase family protein [Lentzea sp. BCCO 10_0856]|uniref:Nitroreductase family protein n=1 Tax=Lentzea miocenica TaxID=3095431 RepID=A0ABU4T6C1_9PSEU|nr:nitroreductase family protein [Lentzea sp. BCCO 10_0856]MDX8033708.1 nitroreductase family protein [Lentzea sp. BCCO 10_0856]